MIISAFIYNFIKFWYNISKGVIMNIERINELARKSREVGLTEDEKQEQAKLRAEYVASFRASLKAQLDNTYVVDENGNKTKLQPKK